MTALAWLLGRLPLPLAALLSRGLAWIWWWLLPVRRDLARQNLEAVFPELPPGSTLRRCVAELLLGYIELTHQVFGGRSLLRLSGFEALQDRSRRGLGSLVVVPHAGAFELAMAATPGLLGVRAAVFAKPPTWPPAARFVEELRRRCGLELLAPSGSMPQVERLLAQGFVVVFPMDQRHNRGLPVPFFDRPAWTSPGLAVAARRSGAPVYGAWIEREAVGLHQVRCRGPLALEGTVEADTRRVNAFFEDVVRRRPHAWLWLHDRWKRPPGPAGGASPGSGVV